MVMYEIKEIHYAKQTWKCTAAVKLNRGSIFTVLIIYPLIAKEQ